MSSKMGLPFPASTPCPLPRLNGRKYVLSPDNLVHMYASCKSMAKFARQPALNKNSLVLGLRSLLYCSIASLKDCPAKLHFSSNDIMAKPLRKITRSTLSLSLAHTSSITEKTF